MFATNSRPKPIGIVEHDPVLFLSTIPDQDLYELLAERRELHSIQKGHTQDMNIFTKIAAPFVRAYNYIRGVEHRAVDDIIADFHKTATELEDAEEALRARANSLFVEAKSVLDRALVIHGDKCAEGAQTEDQADKASDVAAAVKVAASS